MPIVAAVPKEVPVKSEMKQQSTSVLVQWIVTLLKNEGKTIDRPAVDLLLSKTGAGVLCRKHKIPVYATEMTWNAMDAKVGKIPPELRRTFDTFSDFYIGDVGVVPFSIPHDAADPVGYRLWGGGLSIATATDLGHFPRSVRDAVAGSSLVLLESNHDPDMLRHNDHYNERLKQRILGNRGHLSNAACADALLQIVESGTKNVILGHLSGENNTPSLAYHISEDRMTREGIRLGQDLTLDVALRDRVGNIYTLGDGK